VFYLSLLTWIKRGHKSTELKNVFYGVLLLFYTIYSVLAEGAGTLSENNTVSSVLSAVLFCIAFGTALKRRVVSETAQKILLLIYSMVLAWPPSRLLSSTTNTELIIRNLLFFLVYNLELYIGLVLKYKTTRKTLFLCSYFVFVVDQWFLLGTIPIVLSHFLEISRMRLVERRTYKYRDPEQHSQEESRRFLVNSDSTDSIAHSQRTSDDSNAESDISTNTELRKNKIARFKKSFVRRDAVDDERQHNHLNKEPKFKELIRERNNGHEQIHNMA